MKMRRRYSFIIDLILLPILIGLLFQQFPGWFPEDKEVRADIGDRALLLLRSTDFNNTKASIRGLEEMGGRVEHVFPPRTVIARVPKSIDKDGLKDTNVEELFRSWIDLDRLEEMDQSTKIGVSIWNRQFETQSLVSEPAGENAEKDAEEQEEPGPIYNDLRYLPLVPGRVPMEGEVESQEQDREGAPGSPVTGEAGATVLPAPYPQEFEKTSEYMIGSVAVGIVLPESMGTGQNNTENWTPEREQLVIKHLTSITPLNPDYPKGVGGLQWWVERDAEADGNAKLSFVYDFQLGIPTNYEPINTPTLDQNGDGIWDEGLWIQDVMDSLSASLGFAITPPPGYRSYPYFYAVRSYNNYLRDKYETDWAVTVFVVDSLADPDGLFPDGYFAYTYAGGPFTVMTYDNQKYEIGHMNAVTAHEFGHLFYALDQYPPCSPAAKSGFLQVENRNCETNNPGVVPSIMRGQISPFLAGALDYWAKGQIGWWDSDNNGIYDPVDSPYEAIVVSLDQCQGSCLTEKSLEMANLAPLFSGQATASQTRIGDVLFRVDAGAWQQATPADGLFNAASEGFTFRLSPQTAGAHVLEVKGVNDFGGETNPPYRLNLTLLAPDDVRLEAVIIHAPQSGISAGRSMTFGASSLYNDGSMEALDSGLTWSSSNALVGSVDQTGLFWGLKEGSTLITVTWNSPEGEMTSDALPVNVTPYLPIVLLSKNGSKAGSGSEIIMSVSGGGDNLKASVIGPAFPALTPLDITDGLINFLIPKTGNFAGRYTVQVEDETIPSQKATIALDVPLEIIPRIGNLPVGTELTFKAFGSPGPFSWSINGSPQGIGTIGTETGTFSGNEVGTVIVSATDVSNPAISGATSKMFLIETGSLLVKVVDADDGLPVAGAGIAIESMPGFSIPVTGLDGTSLMNQLPVYPLILNVFASGYVTHRHLTPVWPAPGASDPSLVEVSMEKTLLTVGGQVLDMAGFGIEGAGVTISGQLLNNEPFYVTVLTGNTGQYSIGLPEGGSFSLAAFADNFGHSPSLILSNVTTSVENLSFVLPPHVSSEENPVSKKTTIKILDLTGSLNTTNTFIYATPGTQSGGSFSPLSEEVVAPGFSFPGASYLASLYIPGGEDADGDTVSLRIESAGFPDPGYIDYSFAIHPTKSEVAKFSVQQTINPQVGGLVYLGNNDASANGLVSSLNRTSLFIPPNVLTSDQDVTVRIMQLEGVQGITWAKYSFDLFDSNGQSIPATGLPPVLPLDQVEQDKRLIIILQADPDFFDLKSFQNGSLRVQYKENPGDPFISDDSFSASATGSALVIESSHMSTWALNPPVPSRLEVQQGAGGGGGGGCFIAAAASGSPWEMIRTVLKEFFERFLATEGFGKGMAESRDQNGFKPGDFNGRPSDMSVGVRVPLFPVFGFSWLLVYSGSFWAKMVVPGLAALLLLRK